MGMRQRQVKSMLLYGALLMVLASAGGAEVLAATTGSGLSSTEVHKNKDPASRVEAVRLELNQWSGQTEILDKAQNEIDQVLKLDPRNIHALKELTRIQIMRGFMHTAVEENQVHDNYSVGIFQKGSLESAEKTIRKALSIDPKFADGYVLLGSIQNDQLKYKDAAKSLRMAEKLGSTSPWLELEWTYYDQGVGNYSDKERHYNAVIKSGTKNLKALASAYGGLCGIYQGQGKVEKAISMYKKEIELKPRDAWTRGAFARYLGNDLGRTDEAITQVRAALQIMDYGVGERILAVQLVRKWAELIRSGQGVLANEYYSDAMKTFPWVKTIMVYGGSEPAGDILAKELVQQGKVSINATISDGSTALLYAAYLDNPKAVKALLALQADPNIPDNTGLTPLMCAARNGDEAVAKMLLKSGANPSASMQGWTAAALAGRRGNKGLQALLEKAEAVQRNQSHG